MGKATKRASEAMLKLTIGIRLFSGLKGSLKVGRAVIASWQKSQGLWVGHPVFQGMTVREVIEWLGGEDCDV
jgi:hypothetical protein